MARFLLKHNDLIIGTSGLELLEQETPYYWNEMIPVTFYRKQQMAVSANFPVVFAGLWQTYFFPTPAMAENGSPNASKNEANSLGIDLLAIGSQVFVLFRKKM